MPNPDKPPELTPLKAAIPSPDGRFTLTSHDPHFYQNLDSNIRQTRIEKKARFREEKDRLRELKILLQYHQQMDSLMKGHPLPLTRHNLTLRIDSVLQDRLLRFAYERGLNRTSRNQKLIESIERFLISEGY